MQHIRPAELKAWLTDPQREKPLLLDVREPWEFERCHIDGALSVPMNGIPARLDELPRDREIVVICHHGVRSFHVARFLDHNGFTRIINLTGGVDAWAKEVDPTMPTY
ncbi:MAG: rhodanese-like domain-containing protein [Thiobacillaceae bacterium]